MKRLAFSFVCAAALLLGATAAGAQEDYPPTGGAPGVSDSTPAPGEDIVISGGGFAPGSTVTITIAAGGGLTLAEGDVVVSGTAVADASGNFSIRLQVPPGTPAGDYAVVASGIGPDGEPVALRSTVTVVAAGAGGGGLPFTGSNSGVALWVAFAVVALGAALVIGARQRRLAVEDTSERDPVRVG
jgi:hypothetical protein